MMRLCHSRDVPGVWGNRTDCVCEAGTCTHTVPRPTHTVPRASRRVEPEHPLQMDQGNPDYIPTCVQLSRVPCLTDAFHSHISLIENCSQFFSKFPFIKSVHNMTPLFFLNMYIKNKKLKKKSLLCWNASNFSHLTRSLHFVGFVFERHGFY